MGRVAHSGGCLCGSLRYEIGAEPVDTGYCHCRLCQLSTGAPVLAWASFPAGDFAYRKGTPKRYRSSPRGLREFCNECGTQICFRGDATPDRVDLNSGSLDAPASVAPRCHIYTASRIPWFETADRLPRYPGAGPDAPAS